MQNDKFTGYVLAGGKSSRMGNDKAFLKLHDKNFLEIAIDALRPNCSQVKVVLNRSQKHFIEKIPADFSHIFDIFENRGAPGGIHAALKNCETEFAVILAVDLPVVSIKTIETLSKIAMNFGECSAYVPRQNDGRLQPLCAVYRVKDCLPRIENMLVTKKSASVKNFLDKISIKIIGCEILSEEKNILFNVNYPHDLQELTQNPK